MTSRRRLLQIIASSFKWIAHSFTNLYYSLVPTTINEKKVQDKAKVVKVYGNSEVKNQLIVNSGIHQSYQSWTIDNSQGSSTLYATQRWDCPNDFRLTIGHKYLIWFVGTKTIVGSGLTRLYLNVANQQGSVFNFQTQNANIITINSIEAPNNVVNLNTIIGANTTLTVDGYLCFTDLTRRFPFNTPTTLTDARVQKIINRGHIPYNAGTLKNVDIGEFVSEPYNLCDGVFQIRPSDTLKRCIESKVIPAIAGQTYVFEEPTFEDYQYRHFQVLDENGDFIRQGLRAKATRGAIEITLSANERYLRVQYWYYEGNHYTNVPSPEILNTCVHVAGTRTGYAPHTQSHTLPFKYQGSGFGTAHDTLEDGGTEWIFTKNMVDVDLGTQNFVQKDNGSWHFTSVEHSHNYNYTDLTNIVCSIGEQKSAFTLEQKTQTELEAYGTFLYGYGGSYNGFRIFRSDLVNKTVEEVQTAMAGIILKYELATPQVIHISKKHLGIVRIKDLTWYYVSSQNRVYSVSLDKVIKQPENNTIIGNIYCSALRSETWDAQFGANDKIISITGQNEPQGAFGIKDTSCLSINDYLDKYGDYCIFYETEDEVDDIDFEIGVEAGGTLTSNLFSWVENQQTDFTVDFVTKSVNGITIETDLTKKTIRYYGTASANATCGFISSSNDKNNLTVGHKYLLKLNKIGNSGNSKCSVVGLNSSWLDIQDNIYTGIATSQYGQVIIYSGEQVDFTIQYQIIDLTQGFGAGKEPTSINDPCIQYIIKQGYIPTNITGTSKSVASEVLPNIDFKIKCK